MEWIPCDHIGDGWRDSRLLCGLPISYREYVELIPLEITNKTHDYNYAEVKYLLMRHVY